MMLSESGLVNPASHYWETLLTYPTIAESQFPPQCLTRSSFSCWWNALENSDQDNAGVPHVPHPRTKAP